MALAFSQIENYVTGPNREVIADVTMDGSYPAGGYVLAPSNFGLSRIIGVIVIGQGEGGKVWEFAPATLKLKAYVSAAAGNVHGEAASGNVSSSDVVRLMVIGKL